MQKKYENIIKELEKTLKRKRFEHTIGVMYTAQAMAMNYGIGIESAGLAGLVHDCAKNCSEDEMIEKCEKYDVFLTDSEKRNKALIHAKLGSVLAKEKFHIEDKEILSAVRWHTTGKPDMTDLEKIIFIADYIEPGRKPLDGIDLIRKKSFENLDEAMYLILKSTIDYLLEDNELNDIDKYTVDAYDFYKKIHDKA